MSLFAPLENFFRALADTVPLELFVFFGSVVEEIVSPIPSAFVMGTAGTVALFERHSFFFLAGLVLLGSFGKILGATFYYVIGDKLEDVLVRKFGPRFGITSEYIESIGKRFSGSHWKDGGLLFVLRCIPIVPTTPVSLACGIFKMDIRIFWLALFFGNFLKDLAYVYLGYGGLRAFQELAPRLDAASLSGFFSLFFLLAALFLVLYRKRAAFKAWYRARGKMDNFQ